VAHSLYAWGSGYWGTPDFCLSSVRVISLSRPLCYCRRSALCPLCNRVVETKSQPICCTGEEGVCCYLESKADSLVVQPIAPSQQWQSNPKYFPLLLTFSNKILRLRSRKFPKRSGLLWNTGDTGASRYESW
jgi:hypothetical protein